MVEPKMISVLVAQFPVTLDIHQNLRSIESIISRTESDTLIVLPEGCLSGYDENFSFLKTIRYEVLEEAMDRLKQVVNKKQIHLIFGCCLRESNTWYNTAVYFGPQGETFVYRKINLAMNERGYFTAGSALPVVEVRICDHLVKIGIQLCREIRFPEQWRYLALKGVDVFVYLTNAVGDQSQVPIWRSHLVSRAAENQRYALGCNNAHSTQKCPSIVVAPDGKIMNEVLSAGEEMIHEVLDLGLVSDWYLRQSRNDIIRIKEG